MGSYVMDLARDIVAQEGNRFLAMSQEDALRELGRIAREKMVQLIKEDLSHIRVEFDNWFSEETLYQGGDYEKAMNLLRQGDFILERRGRSMVCVYGAG